MAIQQNIIGDSRIDISEISRGIGDPASPRTGDLLFRIQELIDRLANVQSSLLGASLTAAQTITLDLMGRTVVSFQAWTNAPTTTFTLETSFDNVTWRVHRTYTTVASASEGFIVGTRFWRLRSAVAGVAGDTVNLVLQAGR